MTEEQALRMARAILKLQIANEKRAALAALEEGRPADLGDAPVAAVAA